MLAKNIPNTSNKQCPNYYDSWLELWEEETGDEALSCSNKTCKNNAEVGAHVFIFQNNKIVSGNHIIPLCKKCNHPDNIKWFAISDFITPVKI